MRWNSPFIGLGSAEVLSSCSSANSSRWAATVILCVMFHPCFGQDDAAVEPSGATEVATDDPNASLYHTEVVRGQVAWAPAILKERFGISTVPEVAEQSLAILTTDGDVLPLVENLRGRAFRKDERLRAMQLEIWVRRYDKQPFVQVLRIFELQEDERYEIDYWCDVCAIPMYETGPCACCQDHNRLRKRLVSDDEATP